MQTSPVVIELAFSSVALAPHSARLTAPKGGSLPAILTGALAALPLIQRLGGCGLAASQDSASPWTR